MAGFRSGLARDPGLASHDPREVEALYAEVDPESIRGPLWGPNGEDFPVEPEIVSEAVSEEHKEQAVCHGHGLPGEHTCTDLCTINKCCVPVDDTEAFGVVPFNPVTGASYRGGNILRLFSAEAEHGYGAGGWAGYGQWQSAGRQVRKGERSTVIATVASKADENGHVRTFPGKSRRVFHYDQTEEVSS